MFPVPMVFQVNFFCLPCIYFIIQRINKSISGGRGTRTHMSFPTPVFKTGEPPLLNSSVLERGGGDRIRTCVSLAAQGFSKPPQLAKLCDSSLLVLYHYNYSSATLTLWAFLISFFQNTAFLAKNWVSIFVPIVSQPSPLIHTKYVLYAIEVQ